MQNGILVQNPDYIYYILIITFIVGLLQLSLGLIRFSFLINLFSDAAFSAFKTGVSILIVLNQLRAFFGIHLNEFFLLHEIYFEFDKFLTSPFVLMSLYIGFVALIILLVINPLQGLMTQFFVLILGLIISSIVLSKYPIDASSKIFGIQVLGNIQGSFITPGLDVFKKIDIIKNFWGILYCSLSIFGVSIIIHSQVSKYHALEGRYRISMDQEMISLGMIHSLTCWFWTYPSCASISRSYFNYKLGAQSQISGLISAIFIFPFIFFHQYLLYYLPIPIIAAINIVSFYYK